MGVTDGLSVLIALIEVLLAGFSGEIGALVADLHGTSALPSVPDIRMPCARPGRAAAALLLCTNKDSSFAHAAPWP